MATFGEYADIGYRGTVEWNNNVYKFLDTVEIGNGAADDVETTHSGGVDFYKTFMAGLVDAGEVAFTILFDPDNPVVVDRTTRTLTVKFPPKTGQSAGATFACDGYLKAPPISKPIGDKMTQGVTFKLTGKPVFTAGA